MQKRQNFTIFVNIFYQFYPLSLPTFPAPKIELFGLEILENLENLENLETLENLENLETLEYLESLEKPPPIISFSAPKPLNSFFLCIFAAERTKRPIFMAYSNIVTGQFVRISQVPASVWDRIRAKIIDMVILFIYLVATLVFFANMNISDNARVVFAFIFYVPMLTYDLLWEVFNNGQSPGKFFLDLRVVKVDGSMPGIGDFLLRWLLFLVEGPMLGFMGLIPIMATKSSQRFGDMAAGTMVIKQNQQQSWRLNLEEYSYLTDDYKPTFPQAADLSEAQAQVITNTLEPLSADRSERISLLAEKVKQVLAVNSDLSDERFLYKVLHDYHYYEFNNI